MNRNPLVSLLPVVLTVAVTLISGWTFVKPGYPAALDIWPHISRQKVVYEALDSGHSPFWTFKFYCGYPHLRFYGPLFALLGGTFALATRGNHLLALEYLLFLLHCASALAMFLFLRRLTKSPWASAIGTWVYLLVPMRLLSLCYEGNYPQALFYVLLPVGFHALHRLIERPGVRPAAALGVVLGFAVLSHPVYAGHTLLLVAVAATFWFMARPGSRLRSVGWPALSLIVALLVSGFFVLPFVREYRSHIYPVMPLGVALPNLLLMLSPGAKPGGHAGFYIGISAFVLLLAATLFAVFRVRRAALPMLVGLLFASFLVFISPRMDATYSLLNFGLPSARFMFFCFFFASAIIALGWSALEQRSALRSPMLAVLLSLGLLVSLSSDCLPHLLRIQKPEPEDFLPVRLDLYRVLRRSSPLRVLDTYDHSEQVDAFPRLAVYPALGYVFGDLPALLGPPFHQFAPRSMLYVYPWAAFVSYEFGTKEDRLLASPAAKALALMGVSHVVTPPVVMKVEGSDAEVMTKLGITWDDRYLLRNRKPALVLGPTTAVPLLAANRLLPMPRPELVRSRTLWYARNWQELLDTPEIDPYRNAMDVLPVHEDEQPESLPGEPALIIRETRLEHHEVRLRYEARTECFLRLAFSYYPELRVTLDGKPAGFRPTREHFIWLRSPAGEHTLSVTAPLSPLRCWLLLASCTSLLGTAALLAIHHARRRPA